MQVHFYKIFSELHKTAHGEKMAGRTRIHTITRREKEKKKFVSYSDKITQNDTLHTCTGDNANSSR